MAKKKAKKKTTKKAKKKTTKTKPARSINPADYDMAGSPLRGQERLAALSDRVGRAFGRSTALPLNVSPHARVRRLPFGILLLDWLTHGGLVLHRVNRIGGKKSTLKSTLCIAATGSAQRHCRHCKFPLVIDPASGVTDCRCPKPRYWLHDEDAYTYLPNTAAIELVYGRLPEGAVTKHVKGVGRVPVLKCKPPAHLEGKKGHTKAREIVFVPNYRCEPMRVFYVDGEGTIDVAWAEAHGVNTALVVGCGARWAEQVCETVEDATLSRDVDLIIIDSTSVLTPKKELEKSYEENEKIAARATVLGRFVRRHLAAGFEDGLTARYRPTILCTSQVTTKGIGYGQHAYLDTTDGNMMDHAVSLDLWMTEEGYKLDEKEHRAIYGDFGFRVRKNKAGGSPKVHGTIRYWVRETPDHPVGDSDDLATVMKYARQPDIGFLEEGRGRAVLSLHSRYVEDGLMCFPRVCDCTDFLRAHPTIYADLRERVLSKLMAQSVDLELPDREDDANSPLPEPEEVST